MKGGGRTCGGGLLELEAIVSAKFGGVSGCIVAV